MSWIPYPIRVVDGVTGKVALPTQADILRQENRLANVERELEEAEKALELTDDPVSIAKANYDIITARCNSIRSSLANTRRAVEYADREGIGEVRNYEILPATMKESLVAEDASREYPGGEARVNNGRMMLRLMYGHVKLNGAALSNDEIDNMEPTVAVTIGNELQGMMYPDLNALPFWSQRSKISKAKE